MAVSVLRGASSRALFSVRLNSWNEPVVATYVVEAKHGHHCHVVVCLDFWWRGGKWACRVVTCNLAVWTHIRAEMTLSSLRRYGVLTNTA